MLKFLLLPFSILYAFIMRVRNYLYDTGRRGSIQFDANIIAVGNLTVGGTGKTPHIEYLIRLLKQQYKVATLSRGYGRKTKGFIIADERSSALTIGDEPYQYQLKYGNEITVAVGEERALAIPSILLEKPETQVVLLDDAYQHRAVRPLMNILLSDYNRPFYNDFVLPAGRLRESRNGAKRADAVIVSKCPDSLSEKEENEIREKILPYIKNDTPVFFTGIKYSAPQAVFDSELKWQGKKVVLFTGLAYAAPLVDYIQMTFGLEEQISFPDHYSYKKEDVRRIIKRFEQLNRNDDHILMTTEKDMVKFQDSVMKNELRGKPFFYIPIEIYFLKEKEKFDQLVLEKGIAF